MFNEEQCPLCGSKDYTVQDYNEDYFDDSFIYERICQCGNCKSNFIITYQYKLTSVKVSAS